MQGNSWTRQALATIEVLIADDNAPTRTLLRGVLQAVGVTHIREAENGQDALDDLTRRPADLVLLDQAMPGGLSGLDVVRVLRADAGHMSARARVIMVTGYGDRAHVAAARDAGVDEFLVKPITTRALLLRLEAALSRGRDFVDASTFHGPDRRRHVCGPPPQGERRLGDEQLI